MLYSHYLITISKNIKLGGFILPNNEKHQNHENHSHQEHENHASHDDHAHHHHGNFKIKFFISLIFAIPIIILSPIRKDRILQS